MIKILTYNPNQKINTRTNTTKNISFKGALRILPNKNYTKKIIKLISLDIDGTISDRENNKVNSEVKKEITKAIKNSIIIILNTGRDYNSAALIAKELNLNTPIICNYGKYIRQNRQLIYENPSERVDLKGDTLEYLANKYGIRKENIMSIGNDVEDVSMFNKSGISVLVENNNDTTDIKNFADYTVKNTDKSAVALIFKKLLLTT